MLTVLVAATLLSPQMRNGLPGAHDVPVYSRRERTAAAQGLLHLAKPPSLRVFAALTPNHPYAGSGAHLSFWKTSFVLGTKAGGEAGVNFWNIRDQGHINVGFAASWRTLLDCRLIAAGPVTYKVYDGAASVPREQGEKALANGHFLLAVPAGTAISVELWPTPVDAPMGFLGCDLAALLI